MITTLFVGRSARSCMILAGNYFPCYSIAKHAEMHLRECQGSVQHRLSVRTLEGSTPKGIILTNVENSQKNKEGWRQLSPIPEISPGRCEARAL